MRLNKTNFFAALVMIIAFGGLTLVANAVMAQKARPAASGAIQQPVYSEYRGIRLDMTTDEVRSKLGEPALKGDDQDYYVISTTEAAQIVYDAAHKTKTISVDYTGGVGAPEPKTVVGGDLEVSPKGLYKMVRHDGLGFWVSYNRTTGSVTVVTVTIQKM
jgi:hypothetical protein